MGQIAFLVITALIALILSSPTSRVHYDDLALKQCLPGSGWSIHGWWPEYNATKWPQYCDPSRYHEFNDTVVKMLEPNLTRYWNPCPQWHDLPFLFWMHEWKRHGTCCANMSAINYFANAIEKFYQLPLGYTDKCCDRKSETCLIHYSINNKKRWC